MTSARNIGNSALGQPGENVRGLLLGLGMGDFNATLVIPVMWFSPRATDPGMPPVILLTRAIQRTLNRMGADLEVTGILDDPTATCLDQVCGPEWLADTWYELVRDVLSAQQRGVRLSDSYRAGTGIGGAPPLSGVLDFLPDVPGGALTYAAAAVGVWYWLKHKKKTKA